ncbi:AAA family ATPase [Nitrosophilus alvini]|uniref:AAA family ATPase n=1 Tax=Nitrosophilus alvini TaxID=2714855 RepID=UPI0019097FCC|nr:ATP-dependent metallopeptidase FtsH/Yme1/Tma family protein [Nitrosophilus alvini]
MKQKKIQTTQISKKNKVLIALSAGIVALLLLFAYVRQSSTVIDYSTYRAMLKNDMIDSAQIGEKYIYLKSGGKVFKIPKDAVNINELYEKIPVGVKENYSRAIDVAVLFFIAGLLIYMLFFSRKREEMPPIKHQINIAAPEIDDFSSKIKPIVSDVKFKDVAGIEEAKEELEEIIEFLKNPGKFKNFGVRMPKGVLLIGPPGVGKTMIAKAVAGEAGVPFFYQSGSSFVQIYVGMGAKRVRELFAKAKQMAPSIIFIDEIDAVGKARGGMRNDEREATLNQLLTEMDGFEDNSGVIVMAATNKIEMLDEALLRPGRFDRRIFVSLPNAKEREAILKVYLNKIPHFVDTKEIAKMTVGFSGAALSSLVNEAALHALRKGKKIVELEDFEEVKDKVLFGKRKVLAYSAREKEIQAVYQAAKAVTAYWFEIDFDKISLLGSGFKDIDKEIVSKHEFIAKIKLFLSGHAAMQVIYNEEFSNSAQDLARAKILAEDMATRYGMGKKLIGDVTDVSFIMESTLEEVKEFISSQIRYIEKIKEHLLENESISKEEIKKIFNEIL